MPFAAAATCFDRTVFEDVDVRALGRLLQLADQTRKHAPVKFVVPQYIKHRGLQVLVEHPFYALAPNVCIAGKNDEVSADVGNAEIAELDVQIRKDVKFQCSWLLLSMSTTWELNGSEAPMCLSLLSINKWPICPISALCEKFYPLHSNHMPVVKFFASLDLDQF